MGGGIKYEGAHNLPTIMDGGRGPRSWVEICKRPYSRHGGNPKEVESVGNNDAVNSLGLIGTEIIDRNRHLDDWKIMISGKGCLRKTS